MAARSPLKTVSNALMAMLKQDLSVKKDVSAISTTTEIQNLALAVILLAQPAHLNTSAPPAPTQISGQEPVSVLTVPTLAHLATDQEHVLHVSVDSTTSKENANTLVQLELDLSMEFVNAHQELFQQVSVLLVAVQVSLQSMAVADLVMPTVPNVQAAFMLAPSVFQDSQSTQQLKNVLLKSTVPMAKI